MGDLFEFLIDFICLTSAGAILGAICGFGGFKGACAGFSVILIRIAFTK